MAERRESSMAKLNVRGKSVTAMPSTFFYLHIWQKVAKMAKISQIGIKLPKSVTAKPFFLFV